VSVTPAIRRPYRDLIRMEISRASHEHQARKRNHYIRETETRNGASGFCNRPNSIADPFKCA
jgi:hypothetical protein